MANTDWDGLTDALDTWNKSYIQQQEELAPTLTDRDIFAALALVGLISRYGIHDEIKSICRSAYELANNMMEVREE